MPGGPDALYVAARRTLLDAIEAVQTQLDAVVLVGAQAVYIHTGEADLAVAPHTTDADLVLRPAALAPAPLLEDLLTEAGFARSPQDVGAWAKTVNVEGIDRPMVVDLLVPASLAGAGRRGARIPPHDAHAARRANGLEGALVDRDVDGIGSFDPEDTRQFSVSVAGPGALLVAKVITIGERTAQPGRGRDKDALDVLRLLRAIPTLRLVQHFERLLSDSTSVPVTNEAIQLLPRLFGRPASTGCVMAARAAAPLEPADVIAASAAALTQDLLAAMLRQGEPGA